MGGEEFVAEQVAHIVIIEGRVPLCIGNGCEVIVGVVGTLERLRADAVDALDLAAAAIEVAHFDLTQTIY